MGVSFLDKIVIGPVIFLLIFIPTLFIGAVFADDAEDKKEIYEEERENSQNCILNCDDYERSLTWKRLYLLLAQLGTISAYGLGSCCALFFGISFMLISTEDIENEEE